MTAQDLTAISTGGSALLILAIAAVVAAGMKPKKKGPRTFLIFGYEIKPKKRKRKK